LERRLAAILAADVVGYSRLMGEDEAGTLAALKAHRGALIDPKIAEHNGRIVKLMGDGALVEFASVVDAVQCAVEIQRSMAARNEDVPHAQRIDFRIGINLGDVIVEGDDIYGDGVNVAARLEGLAEPGGICISDIVHQSVKAKLDFVFEDLGAQTVKNIAEPVRAFRVALDGKATAPATPGPVTPKTPARRPWIQIAAGFALSLLAVAGLLWWQPWAPDVEPASLDRMAFPLPDKPSIAVLPFANLSDDPSQEYFADGMTEDLITDLSKISGLFVIARNSSFTYKGQQVKVRQVAEELGVRYVLEGSVRRVGDQVRINTQLIDATTGGHVWAERYDRKLDNILAVQDAIMEKVVQALELHLTEMDRNRRGKEPRTGSLEAYDLVLQARKLMTRFDRKAATDARGLLERAIELDPEYAEAHSLLGLYYFDAWRLWGKSRDKNLARALELGKTSVELSPFDPAPHVLLALVHQFRREFDAASREADVALSLGPNDAITLGNLGSMLRWAHRGEEALDVLQQAVRLDPFHPPNYLEWLADAHWLVGDSVQCVEVAERGVALDPNFVGLHVNLAQCYADLGRDEEARGATAEILRTNPRFTLKAYAAYVPYTDDRDLQRSVDLLRKAGLPEKPPLALPDKPSIAILPFDNMSDDPSQDYFADGITEDLITDVSKISGLFVIARNSTFAYKGKSPDVRQVAEELGVRYVVEGSVRRAGNQVRINVQLIDATTGGHLWAERYDGSLEDVFALQDRVTQKIVSALAVQLTAGEEDRVARKETGNPQAYDAFLQGWEYYQRFSADDFVKAIPFFERAVELDPEYGRAYAALASVYWESVRQGDPWTSKVHPDPANYASFTASRVKAEKYAELAMRNPSPLAHRVASAMSWEYRQFDDAIAEAEQAVALDPNEPDGHVAMAWALIFSGQPRPGKVRRRGDRPPSRPRTKPRISRREHTLGGGLRPSRPDRGGAGRLEALYGGVADIRDECRRHHAVVALQAGSGCPAFRRRAGPGRPVLRGEA
jgi:TolB-like protein/class 3 adenylate cyclase